MAAKKKKKTVRRAKPSKGEAKFKRAVKMDRKPRSVVSGRFESTLTDELVDELCTVHREGDLIPGTALACGVHPDLLRGWLEKGSTVDAPDPYARLFATFAVIEAEIRREDFRKVRDPFTKNSAGIIWYLEKRNPMLRKDAVARAGQIFNVAELLEPKTSGLSKEAAVWIAQQLAAHMPDELKPIFTKAGWKPPALGEAPDEQAEDGTDGYDEEPDDDDDDGDTDGDTDEDDR
jgi:hypothetical protein